MINKVGSNNQWLNTNKTADTKRDERTDKASEKKATTSMPSEVLEIGNKTLPSVVYSNTSQKKLDVSEINALKEEANKATENLRKLVEKLILKQGEKSNLSFETETDVSIIKNENIQQVDATDESKEEDPYGVKAVSDRIVKFAIAISGGDTEKLNELKAAIDEGFAAAEKAFGDELPEVCEDTHTEIMSKLDKWSQEGNNI